MKRLFATFLLGLLLWPAATMAQQDESLNAEQLALRTDLLNFLKEEGFMPDISNEGNIVFKAEGKTYLLVVSNYDSNPMFVKLIYGDNLPEGYTGKTVFMATEQLNQYKGVKVQCNESIYIIVSEMFVRNAEPVKQVFYKLMEVTKDVQAALIKECEKVQADTPADGGNKAISSDIPFLVTGMQVAGMESNDKIRYDYGEVIKDRKVRFLKPRITIKPLSGPGTYSVTVKLYTTVATSSLVLMSNPVNPDNENEYETDVEVKTGTKQVLDLFAWGYEYGNLFWKKGTYRIEVWYGDYCLGGHTFSIE